jgi:hypothetical protein
VEISKSPSSVDGLLHDAPETFNGVEVVPAVGGQQMQSKLSVPVLQCGSQLFGPMDATAINNHHDLFVVLAKDAHDLMNILAQGVGVKMRHDLIEDFRGAILDGAQDAEQHPARDPTPRAILRPRLALETFFTFDLALAQWACGQARALGFAPPARSGQGKTPEDRFVFIEQNDLATTSLVLEGCEVE